ncbi:hypothetical protein ABFG93_21135 (plasmid) [Pseudalkalibacillus hwajinpoensis]|uniref:hypothetical protein n=1 Tax=Guptibacillus hwajinpoensis TaxID=208199 RepID=UPI00325AB9CA
MAGYMSKGIQTTLLLQVLWFGMFFTNILGLVGSYNEYLQDLIWLTIPLLGLLIGIIGLSKQVSKSISIINIGCGVIILLSWIAISGIDKM